MFNVNTTFWSSLIIWDFWTWKTYWVENICYQAKDKNPDDILLIANVPMSITDIFFNSPDDLRQIIDYMFRFFIETNWDINKYNRTFKEYISNRHRHICYQQYIIGIFIFSLITNIFHSISFSSSKISNN